MPTFGHAGFKWQLRAKPEQPQTLPVWSLGHLVLLILAFFKTNQCKIALIHQEHQPKLLEPPLCRARPALLPGPASAPGVGSSFWRRQSSSPGCCLCPHAPVPVGAVGLSQPGAGPAPFHKCLIPAQSRSSATHKHLSPSSHLGVPAAPRQLLPPLQPAEEKTGWGGPD